MIADMLRDLLPLDDPFWDAYAMRREPLIGRISEAQAREFAENARRCGEELAIEAAASGGNARPEDRAKRLGLTVEHKAESDGGGYTMFACFQEPDRITVFQETVDRAEKLIEEENLSGLLSGAHPEDVLIAHELYHYFECARPELYTNQKLLCLWKLGKFQNRSQVVSLQEIGAMAFAKRLLGLPYSPFVFDVLLLYAQNKRLSKNLYEDIMKHAGRKEL
jgi:hypothetical protein